MVTRTPRISDIDQQFQRSYFKPLRKKPRNGRISLLVAMDLGGLFRRIGDSQFTLSHLMRLPDGVHLRPHSAG